MKTVLVTGATRGIGLATSEKFASHNYNVVINYVTREDLAINLAKELEKKYKIKTLTIKADVGNEIEVKEMIAKIKTTFGKIDCLVNNAGIARDNNYLEKDSEEFLKVIKTNLLGSFLVTKHASLIMDKGAIINVSSNAGIDAGYVEAIDYDASKAGIIALTHDFAKALSPKIRVNAVAPGWVKTDMNKDLSPDFQKMACQSSLLKRMGEPSEIANVIFFLATDEASFINDAIIKIDGGLE